MSERQQLYSVLGRLGDLDGVNASLFRHHWIAGVLVDQVEVHWLLV
jgi:hypothetical protein